MKQAYEIWVETYRIFDRQLESALSEYSDYVNGEENYLEEMLEVFDKLVHESLEKVFNFQLLNAELQNGVHKVKIVYGGGDLLVQYTSLQVI